VTAPFFIRLEAYDNFKDLGIIRKPRMKVLVSGAKIAHIN
jgi:hypothetical protein